MSSCEVPHPGPLPGGEGEDWVRSPSWARLVVAESALADAVGVFAGAGVDADGVDGEVQFAECVGHQKEQPAPIRRPESHLSLRADGAIGAASIQGHFSYGRWVAGSEEAAQVKVPASVK